MPRPPNPLCVNCRTKRARQLRTEIPAIRAISRSVPAAFCSVSCLGVYGFKALAGAFPVHLCVDRRGWRNGSLADCKRCTP